MQAPSDRLPRLEVEALSVRFGGVDALRDASIRLLDGSTHGLIGPNGAGKTTLFNCVSGFIRPTSGRIAINGTPVKRIRSHELASLGVARTFQHLGVIRSMTVLENFMFGGYGRHKGGYVAESLVLSEISRRERLLRAEAHDLLEDLGLGSVASVVVDALPFGTLKRVELGRALMSKAKLLLLDEPANGLTQGEVLELAQTLRDLKERYGLTIMLVEHHMGLVMEICDEITVLNAGKCIASGKPQTVARDPQVVDAYLGQSG